MPFAIYCFVAGLACTIYFVSYQLSSHAGEGVVTRRRRPPNPGA